MRIFKYLSLFLVLFSINNAYADSKVQASIGQHKFMLEVADTPESREKGLMFRESLAEDGGMLFQFDTPRVMRMWMKNTYIPLDMLFVKDNGEIVNIAKNTTPLSLSTISSEHRVSAVIELKGGITDKLGVKIGDKVEIVK